MASSELSALESRLRRSYEWGRLRLALAGASPLLAFMGLAVLLGQRPLSAVAFGCVAVAIAGASLFYGRAARRGVLPGALWGLVPLVASLVANRVHHCGPDGCTSLCLPACALGGLVAGWGVARASRSRAGVGFWLAASGLTLATGAMGCACIGYSGVLGLTAGYLVSLAPSLGARLVRGA